MKAKGFLFCLASFFLFSFLVGCNTLKPNIKVKTYTVEEARVDQNLEEGNRGYLIGRPQEIEGDRDRKLTRTKYVAEVDLGPDVENISKKKAAQQGTANLEIAEEPDSEAITEEVVANEAPVQKSIFKEPSKVVRYVVEKDDTLQKISKKFYGTTKKWKKIYDANANKIKSPDRIFKGEVLEIPQD